MLWWRPQLYCVQSEPSMAQWRQDVRSVEPLQRRQTMLRSIVPVWMRAMKLLTVVIFPCP
jgi:hypothetical protein